MDFAWGIPVLEYARALAPGAVSVTGNNVPFPVFSDAAGLGFNLPADGQTSSERSMTITDLVAPEAIIPALKVNSKKQALQELAARASTLTGQSDRAIFEVLLQREKLGTTAVGYGVAIPHGKLPKLERLFGLFARLDRPIDFEAMDGQPVDLVFLLLAPEGAGADHLKALARIARLLRDQDVAKKLRASRDAQAIYSVLALPPATAA
jgi:PTS system nitrogen regulatory IIA component